MYMPEYETTQEYKNAFSIVPIYKEIYADTITPIALLKRIAAISDQYFLLESVEGGKSWGRYSFIGFDPIMTIHLKEYELTIKKENEIKKLKVEQPYEFLRELLTHHSSPKLDEIPPFTGGLVGNLSYPMIGYAESRLRLKKDESNDFDLMLFEKVAAYDHFKQKIYMIVNYRLAEKQAGYDQACRELERMIAIIGQKEATNETETPEQAKGYKVPEFTSDLNYEEFERIVKKTQQYIKDGDIFQSVISRRFQADFSDSLMDVYRVLRTTNPSPYMFYMKMAEQEYVGTSPETLVKLVDRKLTTFPVAGTRKRGADALADQKLEEELLADEKELAEHNMLVDLARNDIGRVAQYGTVKVEEYMQIHRYSKVMHIASVVSGQMRDEYDAFDAISRILPAGTLSGAPKIRACEIINELEPVERGIYGGAIGYIDFTGNMDTCIAIRMAVKRKGKLYVQAGAGIVADSDPKSEFEETENKAGAIIQAVRCAGEVGRP